MRSKPSWMLRDYPAPEARDRYLRSTGHNEKCFARYSPSDLAMITFITSLVPA